MSSYSNIPSNMLLHKDLPRELFDHILTFITQIGHLKTLCEVSKSFNYAVTPKLYESVTIHAPSMSLDHVSTDNFPMKHLVYTKRLGFTTSVKDQLANECLHSYYELESPRGLLVQVDDSLLKNLGARVALFCSNVPKDQLLEFSWDMGMCIPAEVLGKHGCLGRQHKELQQLHLLTNGSCNIDPSIIHLSEFGNIKRFAWSGCQSGEAFQAIKECLRANASHLEELELSFCQLNTVTGLFYTSRRPISLAGDILKLQDSSPTTMFPVLRRLTLSFLSFKPIINTVVNTIDFGHLQSLKIWDCDGIFQLLLGLLRSGHTLQLKTFELIVPEFNVDANIVLNIMEDFLQSFNSLKILYLMIYTQGQEVDFCRIARAITSHKDNLQNLVFHLRALDLEEGSNRYEMHEDCHFNWTDSYMGLVNCSKLQYVGEYWLTPAEPKPAWRILHIRDTTEFGRRLNHSDTSTTNGHNTDDEDEMPDNEDVEASPDVEDGDMDISSENRTSDAEDSKLNLDGEKNAPLSIPFSSFVDQLESRVSEDGPADSIPFRSEDSESPEARELRWALKRYTSELDVDRKDFARILDAEVERKRICRGRLELFEFAQWAFGPRGLPNLELLAVGDFSKRGFRNFILCRNEYIRNQEPAFAAKDCPLQLNFRTTTKDDTCLLSMLTENSEFFGACEAYLAMPGVELDLE